MKPPELLRRLTMQTCVALLLLNSAPAALAQRPRRRPSPRRPQAQAPARPNNTPEAAPGQATQPPTRRAEPELSVEEMLAADSYTVYAEVRRVGTLARAEELKSAVATLRLVGGEEAQPVTDLYTFVSENAEALGESRVVLAFMPARAEVPQALMAVELETPETAAAFEPKLRRLLAEKVPQVRKTIAGAGITSDPVLVVPPKPEPRAAAKPAAPDFELKRAGRWLLASDAAFTLKRLRGDEDRPSLAGSPRFQTVRARFANDSVFVYVDTDVAQQGWALQAQKASEGRQPPDAPAAVAQPTPAAVATGGGTVVEKEQPNPEEVPPTEDQGEPSVVDEIPPEVRAQYEASVAAAAAATPEPTPSEEELAVRGMGRVMSGLWSGVPRIPGAVALGASLDRGALAVRLAVENTPDGTVALIPFVPNLISGPPVTGETASVAPADSELFIAGSLDWTRVYNSALGSAALGPVTVGEVNEEGVYVEKGGEKQPTVDETVAAIEKIFGFKFKEDLLPALGNEVAISLPLTTGYLGLGGALLREEKKEERDAEPGFLYLAALNNPERLREILPRVLVVFGFASPGAPQRVEQRKGFDIHTLGAGDGFSYAFINNFLVFGELKAVRHCVDSFDAHQTLAASNAYRDAVAWQARQKLAHLYLSDSLMKFTAEQTKTRSGGSTDPLVRALLAQLDAADVAPASYEATDEGDVVMHEARLPVALLRTYGLSVAISARDYPVIMNETMAVYALQRVARSQTVYKDDHKKGRFATMEELVADGILEKGFPEHSEYKFEMEVVGDRFQVSATPRSYGKTGRRSFLIDQTGTVRGDDHKGQPAGTDDPTVEQ